MLKRRTTVRALYYQDQLAKGLLSIMQKMEYEDITVAALCREAGVSRNTFYRNFADMDDLLGFAVDNICLQYQDDQEGFLQAGSSVAHFLEFFRAHPTYFDAFRKSRMTEFLIGAATHHACRQVQDAAGRQEASQRWVSSFLAAGLLNLYEQWREEDFHTPVSEIAQAVLAYIPALGDPRPVAPDAKEGASHEKNH